MIKTIINRLIEKGQTEGLAEKIDVFFAAGKLTKKDYKELTAALSKGA